MGMFWKFGPVLDNLPVAAIVWLNVEWILFVFLFIDEGKASMEGFDERVDLPATERIKELTEEGLSPEEIIMRGFSFEKVNEALKNGS